MMTIWIHESHCLDIHVCVIACVRVLSIDGMREWLKMSEIKKPQEKQDFIYAAKFEFVHVS